jgi:calcineurin-like phosphoesterase family protein
VGDKLKDWHDDYILDGETMKIYVTADTHFNHQNMQTYCQRPPNFTEIIQKRWHETVKDDDTVIHLGDVAIGKKSEWIMPSLPGRKILIRGNHDRSQSVTWWMEHGFNFACDSLIIRQCWLTHEPVEVLPAGCTLNIHGHLHNIWDGFHNPERIARDKELLGVDFTKRLRFPWQRLFALEYTEYRPVEFDKFISHPDKYKSRGPNE